MFAFTFVAIASSYFLGLGSRERMVLEKEVLGMAYVRSLGIILPLFMFWIPYLQFFMTWAQWPVEP